MVMALRPTSIGLLQWRQTTVMRSSREGRVVSSLGCMARRQPGRGRNRSAEGIEAYPALRTGRGRAFVPLVPFQGQGDTPGIARAGRSASTEAVTTPCGAGSTQPHDPIVAPA